MTKYMDLVAANQKMLSAQSNSWSAINAEYVTRMQLQNRFKTGLDIARYTADIMRKDMADYDADSSKYTQSLGCWHGFTAQQMLMAVKRHQKTVDKSYVYLSGWMVAALRSDFGPLPDQSMHEKTSVPGLIEEIYTFLKQADARNCGICLWNWTKRAPMAAMLMRCWPKSTISKPMSCQSLLILMPVSAMKKRLICWQRK